MREKGYERKGRGKNSSHNGRASKKTNQPIPLVWQHEACLAA